MSVAIGKRMEESAPETRGPSGPSDVRSGEFSRDPMFDPAELFAVIEREHSVDAVVAAMQKFKRSGDLDLLARGVAVFARSARARGDSVETVLGGLQRIIDALESRAQPGFPGRETPLGNLALRGVLMAFYGEEVVDREADARDRRVEHQTAARRESTDGVTE
jgi:hypothetical protein